MTTVRTILILGLAAVTAHAALTPEQKAKLPPATTGTVDFKRDIQPIIEKSCVSCHGRGRNKGDFVVDTRETFLKGGDSGPAAIPGKSTESLIIELVSGADPEFIMPAKGTKLTPKEVGLMRAWIDQGVKWDPEITFAKQDPRNLRPRTPGLPRGKGNPVDRLLASYFKANKVKAQKPVEDRIFARRAYLDVIGLLPTVGELDRFVANRSANKRADLVRELLGRKNDYAQHWMTFWNDMLRNDYRGTGYIDGGRKQITGWLYSALATNMPFDRFVAELVNPTPASEGFAKGIVWRGVVNASQTPEMQAAQNISQVFMGVNLKCASCHDSFINNWTLADAYGLASVYSDKPLELVECDKPTGKTALVKFIYPELGTIDANAPKPERLKRLAEIVTSPEDGRLSRTIVNRLWARFFGRGLVEPVDEMENAAWNSDLLDWLAADLVEHKYDLKHMIQLMLNSVAYQMPAVAATEVSEKEFVFRGPTVRRLSAEQFLDAIGTITGVWHGDAVPELNFVSGSNETKTELKGKWIWSTSDAAARAEAKTVTFQKSFQLPDDATEARVVMTCDNAFKLKVNGKDAGNSKDYTRPKAIDIRKFLTRGTNEIVVEATNHPGSPGRADVDQSNPAGLFAFIRLRTKAGVLDFGTDATWSAESSHAVELGSANMGPWTLGAKLERLVANQDFAANCRAVLANADPLMVALGRPNREQVITTRASAATTLQALELTNGATLAQRMKDGAANLALETDTKRLVEKLYLSALGRKPTGQEFSVAKELATGDGVEDLLWAVCMLPEFQLIR